MPATVSLECKTRLDCKTRFSIVQRGNNRVTTVFFASNLVQLVQLFGDWNFYLHHFRLSATLSSGTLKYS